MTDKISFGTPVRHDPPTSVGQMTFDWVESYFHVKRRKVAVIVPDAIKNGSRGVELKEEQPSHWKTALKVVTYFTLILPVLMFIFKVIIRTFYAFHQCRQTLPDGTRELGVFVDGKLTSGLQVKRDKTFVLPIKLLDGKVQLKNGRTGSFAEVRIDEKETIRPVEVLYEKEKSTPTEKYVVYSDPEEILLKMAQKWNPNGKSPIKDILQHPGNKCLSLEDFISYLLIPNNNPPLSTVSNTSLLEILELAKITQIVIPTSIINLLFDNWAGSGSVNITRHLLELKPTLSKIPTHFKDAACKGFKEEASILLAVMYKENIKLDESIKLIIKAFENDSDFTKEQFDELSTSSQEEMFQIANIYVHLEVLAKLQKFGMGENPAQPKGKFLFSYNMDARHVIETLKSFVSDLQAKNMLLKNSEFTQRNLSQSYQLHHRTNGIQQLLEGLFIEETASNLNLPSIKVAKKIVIIKPENESNRPLEFEVTGLSLKCLSVDVYSEKIEPIQRKATQKEIEDVLNLLEKCGYDETFKWPKGYGLIMGKNLEGEEGIFFVPSEFHDSSATSWYQFEILMNREDYSWLTQHLTSWCHLKNLQNQASTEYEQKEFEKRTSEKYGFHTQRKFSIEIS